MTERTQTEIFAANLNRILAEKNFRQIDVAQSIGVSPQTFNTWTQGKAIPRMDKVQRLADFFCVSKSELIEEHYDDDLSDALQHAFDDRPEMRMLFSVAEGATKEDIEKAIQIIEVLKGKR